MNYEEWLKEKLETGFQCKIMFSTPRQANEFRDTLVMHGLNRIIVEKNGDVHFEHNPMVHFMGRTKAEEIIKKTALSVDKNFKMTWVDNNE